MDVTPNEAASGLLPEGNAGNGKEIDGLSKALNTALAGFDEGDVPLSVAAKAKTKTTDAGDKSDSEDATKAPVKASAEAPVEGAAPEGNAPVEAPKHWPAERRQAFAALAPEAQKLILAQSKDLEGGFTRKSQELSDTVKYAEGIRGAIGDTVRQQFAAHGMDEVAGVRYLTQLQQFATTRPAEYVVWAMQNLGVRPEHLGLSVASQQPQRQTQQAPQQSTGDPRLDELLRDPAVEQLRNELGQTRATVQQLETYRQQQEQYRAQQEQQRQYQERQREQQIAQQLNDMWGKFRSTLDDNGQLKYPNADVLREQIGSTMQYDPKIAQMPDNEAKIVAAYEAAEWARGDFRTTRLEQERAKAAADAAKSAEAARAKKVTAVKPASGAPAVPKKSGGLNAALEAGLSKLGLD